MSSKYRLIHKGREHVKRWYRAPWVLTTIVVGLILICYVLDYSQDHTLRDYTVHPLETWSLRYIMLMPFWHGDLEHLAGNLFGLIPLLVVLSGWYPHRAWWLFLLMIFGTGILTWFLGREGAHIGASGLVYSLAGFVVFAALRHLGKGALGILLIMSLLYGGLWSGLVPGQDHISNEGHLAGLLSGMIVSLFVWNVGPNPEFANYRTHKGEVVDLEEDIIEEEEEEAQESDEEEDEPGIGDSRELPYPPNKPN